LKNLVTLGNVLGKVLGVSILFFILFFASCAKDPLPTPTPPPPTPAPTVPGIPSIVEATATGAGIVSVAVVAPTSDGGKPITGYTVISNPDNVTVTSTISSESNKIVVSGLKDNGTEYDFTVKAVNSVGSSASSAPSAKVVPADSKTNLLMYSKGWKWVGYEMLLEPENKWISVILNECQKDDVYIFKANGKGSFLNGPQSCGLSDYNFTWSWNADKTKLDCILSPTPCIIDILNQDTLRVIKDGLNLNTGAVMKFRLTYEHEK